MNKGTGKLDEPFQIWMEYTKQIESPYLESEQSKKDKTFHVSMAGIIPGYEGLYLARLAILVSMRKAYLKGYRKLFSVLTHQGSQGIAQDRYAQTLYELKFSEFTFEGKKPLSSIQLESAKVAILQIEQQTELEAYTKRMEVLQKVHTDRYNKLHSNNSKL